MNPITVSGIAMNMKKGPKSWQAKHLVWLFVGIMVAGSSLGCFSKKSSYQSIQTCFTPGGQCAQFVEEALAKAQDTILVQAYAFTSSMIADALIAAHTSGVIVQILMERSQLTVKKSQIRSVIAKGIPVFIDVVPGIAHNKVMIIDDTYVLTGSFNWTDAAAYRNAENLVLIRDYDTNQAYRINWEERAREAQAIKLADIDNAA